MNTKRLLCTGLLIVALRGAGLAASGDMNRSGSLGLGAEFGQPMAVTGKLWLSDALAVDGALGYHWNHNFDMHADFLFHTNALTATMNGTLPLYAGLGARLLAGDDTQFGLRIPLGVSYFMRPRQIELFAEIAPIVDLSSIGADVDGVVGIRVYAF